MKRILVGMTNHTLRFIGTRLLTSCVLGLAVVSVSATIARAQDHPEPTDVQTSPDTMTPKAARKPVQTFTLTDDKGKPLNLASYKGKVVLLDFWATWCGGCKIELPWYVEFDKKYKSQGLAVIGVSMDDEGMKVVKPFLAQKHIEYPVVIGNDALSSRFGLESLPTTLLIDRDGKVAIAHTGVVDKADFEHHIQQLLKQ